jgi:flagellar biosynthetic protein FliO
MGGAIIRLIVCLPVVGLLAYLFIKFSLTKTYLKRQGYMQTIEQIALTPKATLSIVKVGNEHLLLSVSEGGVNLIKQIEDYQEDCQEELQQGQDCTKVFQFQSYLCDAVKKINRGHKSHA